MLYKFQLLSDPFNFKSWLFLWFGVDERFEEDLSDFSIMKIAVLKEHYEKICGKSAVSTTGDCIDNHSFRGSERVSYDSNNNHS